GAKRPILVPRVAGVLDELARGHPAVELLLVEEVVVDAVALAGPRGARGGRHRQLQPGDALHQSADERALADPRGAGDHEDVPHGRLRARGPEISAAAS